MSSSSTSSKKKSISSKVESTPMPNWMNETCHLCKTPFWKIGTGNILLLPCLHKFSRDCISKLKVSACPICKKPFSSSVVKKKSIISETPKRDDDECGPVDVIRSDEEVSTEDSSEGSLADFVEHDSEDDASYYPEDDDDDDDDDDNLTLYTENDSEESTYCD